MPKTVAPQAAAVSPLQAAFQATDASMNTRLVERASIIKTALLALVARVHVFYLGSPGTAKSLTIRTLKDHISGLERRDYFERLLTAQSTETAVWGPPDLLAMEQGIDRVVIDNKLAQAKLAFLDEVFKCNDATLNALLTGMNERIFHNDEIVEMDLWSLFAASNELPSSTDLAALYDRFHIRHVIKPIQSSGNFVQMLRNRNLPPVVPTLTKEDVQQAQAECAQITVSDEVLGALRDLRGELRSEGIEPTDRRFSDCIPVIQATAWWHGSPVAEVEDMAQVRHMLWMDPNEIPLVEAKVLNLASPLEAEAKQRSTDVQVLCDSFDKIMKDADNDQQRNRKAIELHTKLDKVTTEIEELEGRITSGGRKSEILTEAKERVLNMTDALLTTVFKIDPNKVVGK